MTPEMFWYIIFVLVGIILGGAGGQALIRRAIGNIGSNGSDTAATAAAAAATAAATAAASLNGHVSRLENSISKQWDTLNEIKQQQTKLGATFSQFPEMCKLKHEAVEKEQSRMQSEIDILQTKT